MVKRKHTKYYELKMRSNKLKYSAATGLHCTTHDVRVTFFVLDLSSSNIIEHLFHVNNDKFGSDIGYEMIIGSELIVQLGLAHDFNNQFL